MRLSGTVRRLRVEAVYHSSHPRPAGLTVTTVVSLERLHFLKGLCASWEGPLMAAAYLPRIAGHASMNDNVTSLHETFHMCVISAHQGLVTRHLTMTLAESASAYSAACALVVVAHAMYPPSSSANI